MGFCNAVSVLTASGAKFHLALSQKEGAVVSLALAQIIISGYVMILSAISEYYSKLGRE